MEELNGDQERVCCGHMLEAPRGLSTTDEESRIQVEGRGFRVWDLEFTYRLH